MNERDTVRTALRRRFVRRAASRGLAQPRLTPWTAGEGFTLVELLAVMVMAAIVGAAILAAFASMLGVFNEQDVRIQNQDDARTAINQITRYLRMATSSVDNQSSRSNAIATALPQDVEFYCDVDGDSVAEKVRYYLDETNLRMQTAEPVWVDGTDPHWEYPPYDTDGTIVQEAVRNGTAPVFGYCRYVNQVVEEFTPLDAAGRQEIVTVSITLTVNERPDLARGNVVLATDVQIRQRYEGSLQ